MNDKVNNYRHVIVKCNTDQDVIDIQNFAFKNGFGWASGDTTCIYTNIRECQYIIFIISKINSCIIRRDGRLVTYSKEEIIPLYRDNYYCDNFKNLKELFNENDCSVDMYNKPKILVYD